MLSTWKFSKFQCFNNQDSRPSLTKWKLWNFYISFIIAPIIQIKFKRCISFKNEIITVIKLARLMFYTKLHLFQKRAIAMLRCKRIRVSFLYLGYFVSATGKGNKREKKVSQHPWPFNAGGWLMCEPQYCLKIQIAGINHLITSH